MTALDAVLERLRGLVRAEDGSVSIDVSRGGTVIMTFGLADDLEKVVHAHLDRDDRPRPDAALREAFRKWNVAPASEVDCNALRERAESAELGCEIAYRREPTQAEGDAHESGEPAHAKGECFVPMGGWTGRRCRVCRRWVWGGPTACVGCVSREDAAGATLRRESLLAHARGHLAACEDHLRLLADLKAPTTDREDALLLAYEQTLRTGVSFARLVIATLEGT